MQTIDPLNTVPLQLFLQQLKAADSSRSKEVKIPIEQARALGYTIGIVMSRLEGDLEKLVKESNSESNEIIDIQIGASNNWK